LGGSVSQPVMEAKAIPAMSAASVFRPFMESSLLG
jgi:hypothetical protein